MARPDYVKDLLEQEKKKFKAAHDKIQTELDDVEVKKQSLQAQAAALKERLESLKDHTLPVPENLSQQFIDKLAAQLKKANKELARILGTND